MKVLKGVASAVVLAVAVASCSGGIPNPGKSLQALSLKGDVQFRRNALQGWSPLPEGLRLGPGAEVKTGEGSTLVLGRDDGARIDVAASSALGVIGVRRVRLDAGSVLAAVEAVALTIEASGVEANAKKSIVRVDRDYSVRVAAYGGSATVTENADRLLVPALRQVEVAGGIIPRGAVPMRFSALDTWDKQLLADVIDLDRELRTFGRAFKANYSTKAADPRFYASLLPAVSVQTFSRLIAVTGDTSDALFGVVMAKRLRGSAASNMAALISLKLAGGTWGLIAKIMHVPFKDYVNNVIATTVPGATPTGGPTTGPAQPTTRPSPSASPTPSRSPSPSPSPSPSATSPSPSPSPCSDLDRLLGRCGNPLLGG